MKELVKVKAIENGFVDFEGQTSITVEAFEQFGIIPRPGFFYIIEKVKGYGIKDIFGGGCVENNELAVCGFHEYDEKTCPNCGQVFCYNCCGGTNVDNGSKYEPDYMDCPSCGHDWYRRTEEEQKEYDKFFEEVE